MPESLEESRAKLKAHFGNGGAGDPNRWEALWNKGEFLPWDRGAPSPALEDFLADRNDLVGSCMKTDSTGVKRRKKAFVPGCGRGYDVLLLASFGYDALGLEVSESAVKRCFEEKEKHGDKYTAVDASIGAGYIDFVEGDFFKDDWISRANTQHFDLIYDYTFLCALPPSSRPEWASRMSELLDIEGFLVCLEFPSAKDPKAGGPPYALPAAVYKAHLTHPGDKVPYKDDGYVEEDAELASNPMALQSVDRWQPARTHEIGKGQDWMSVWQHVEGHV